MRLSVMSRAKRGDVLRNIGAALTKRNDMVNFNERATVQASE